MQRKLQRSVIEILRSSAMRPYESRSGFLPIWSMIDAMTYENIQLEVAPPIATITLNRPKVLNALSPALIAEVGQALGELDGNPEVRAVVLTGGPKVFAAGADIGDMAERTAAEQLTRDMTGAVAQRMARQLAEKPPLATRLAKESVLKAYETPLGEGLASERRSFYFLFSTEDQKEGMRAFLEKRKGVFKGR